MNPKDIWDCLCGAIQNGNNPSLVDLLTTWLASPNPCVGCAITGDDRKLIGGTPILLRTAKNATLTFHKNAHFGCGCNNYLSSVCYTNTKMKRPTNLEGLKQKFESLIPPGIETSENAANMNRHHPIITRAVDKLTGTYQVICGNYPQPAESRNPPTMVVKSRINQPKYLQGKTTAEASRSRVDLGAYVLKVNQQYLSPGGTPRT